MGITLLEADHPNFILLEQAPGVGGTWWHNRYPGAACDVPSHLHNRSRLGQEFEGFVMLTDPARYQQSVELGLANLALVEDPSVRRQLTPNYSFGCKRVLLSSKYYQTFKRANVQLVTDTIREVTPTGVITDDGVEHAMDILILATSVNVTRYLSSIPVAGRAGRGLTEAWQC